jgi:hypothetical protein
MIYCFNEDFAIRNTTAVIQTEDVSVARLTANSNSLFVQRMILNEPDTTYGNRLVLDGASHTGQHAMINRLLGMDQTDRELVITGLFSILGMLKTTLLNSTVETLLTGNTYYVAGSASQATGTTTVGVIQSNNTTLERSLYDWVGFDFQLDVNTVFTFKVFYKEPVFIAAYPYTKLGTVIYPIPVNVMVDMADHNSQLTLSNLNSSKLIQQIHNSTYNTDATGVVLCESYFGDGDGAKVVIGVTYQGKLPSLESARTYIANDLVATTRSVEYWQTVLPEIFADDEFYYVPLWDHVHVAGVTSIFPCILPLQLGMQKLSLALPELPSAFVAEHIASIQASGPDTYLMVVPGQGNADTRFSLLNVYPDYIRDNSPIGLYNFVTPSTKEFMTVLSQALTQARNGTVVLGKVVRYGKEWYSFVHAGCTHYILMKYEYDAL